MIETLSSLLKLLSVTGAARDLKKMMPISAPISATSATLTGCASF